MKGDNFEIMARIIAGSAMVFIIIAAFVIFYPIEECCACGIPKPSLMGGDCCPCPNGEYYEIVKEHYNATITCESSWHDYCRKYQQEMNLTFDCFEGVR